MVKALSGIASTYLSHGRSVVTQGARTLKQMGLFDSAVCQIMDRHNLEAGGTARTLPSQGQGAHMGTVLTYVRSELAESSSP